MIEINCDRCNTLMDNEECFCVDCMEEKEIEIQDLNVRIVELENEVMDLEDEIQDLTIHLG